MRTSTENTDLNLLVQSGQCDDVYASRPPLRPAHYRDSQAHILDHLPTQYSLRMI